LRKTAEKILDEDYALYYSPVETYFVNFLREPPEPTGEEPEDFVFEAPKIYEEMPRYARACQQMPTHILLLSALNPKAELALVFPRHSQLRVRDREGAAEYGAI